MVTGMMDIGMITTEKNIILNREKMYMNIKQCDVCGKDIKIDKYGNGICKNCGWNDCEASLKYPNEVRYPNITSFNNAKNLVSKNQKLKPTYEEFLIIVKENLEPSFKYKNKKYGSTQFDGYEFYEWNKDEGYQSYKTIEEFDKNVNIKGVRLKDLWENISHFEISC